jgi:hypothetical protein
MILSDHFSRPVYGFPDTLVGTAPAEDALHGSIYIFISGLGGSF